MEGTKGDTARFLFRMEGYNFSVLEFEGEETLSGIFHFRIRLKANDARTDPVDLVKKRAKLVFLTKDNKEREIQGHIGRATIEQTGKYYAVYSVDLYSRLWLLGFRKNSRIYQKQSVPDIIIDVLKRADFIKNVGFRMLLSDNYPQREYCVQYRETDYQFICRLASEEGIFFLSRQDLGHEQLIFGDDLAAAPDCFPESKAPFQYKTGQLHAG
ncbi:MAG: type VI secretion system tip protein VgrG, partial [Deltaproteobacteria bacterium]|nr:type VI secretion system tip protein VgrG [Deltaproteobacteria bacterium]